MTLKTGTRLGPYVITAPLGSGGMGEVYRATDTKLKREVAIKILPEDVARDRNRLARFEREAHVLASLNHPHIASIYGLEESDGVPCLVLELVEGQTLAEHLKEAGLPVEKALELARQIASALESAHEKGVIHRDLKPANIKVTPEGSAKVLDFGLAKAFADESTEISSDASQSPTLTAATRAGVILGTAAYMSPEQARGKRVDKRTDIWAFGCVLYEMLTGLQAFPGETASDAIARILEHHPDWQALPAKTPLKIQELLRRCLQKDRYQRMRDAGDVRIEIAEALNQADDESGEIMAAVSGPAVWRRRAGWTIVGALTGAALAIGFLAWSRQASSPIPLEIPVATPPGLVPIYDDSPSVALSPDGRSVVYVGESDGERLYLQDLEPPGSHRPLPDTEGARHPFFSPDGQWIVYHREGKLYKVAVGGGRALPIADVEDFWGASWTFGDDIIFSGALGIQRVSASGGTPEVLTSPDPDRGEFAHTWPQVLPGGQAILYTVAASGTKERVVVSPLPSGDQTVLFEDATYSRYVPTGHIVYAMGDILMARRFDPERFEVGEPVRLHDNVSAQSWDAAQFAFSRSGSLVYLSGSPDPGSRLVRIDRAGTRQSLTPGRPRVVRDLRIAPDGERVALEIYDPEEGTDIWIYHLARDDFFRLTFEPGWESQPIWTHDGQGVTFTELRQGRTEILTRPVNASRPAELFVSIEPWGDPYSWSPDDRLLAVVKGSPEGGRDIWVYSTEGAEEFLRTPFDETEPAFSPDGRWLAYRSTETGRSEIYVRPYPGPGAAWKVSTSGGRQPRWSSDRTRLFYRRGSQAMVATVQTGPDFSSSLPGAFVDGLGKEWDVSPDGEYVITLESVPREPPRMHLILNWFDELRRRVPAR